MTILLFGLYEFSLGDEILPILGHDQCKGSKFGSLGLTLFAPTTLGWLPKKPTFSFKGTRKMFLKM